VRLADAHVHLFDGGFIGRYGRPCSGGDDIECYGAFRREHEIGAALVVGYEGDARYIGNSRFIADLARSNDWIAPLAFVLPDSPAIPGEEFLGISLYLLGVRDTEQLADWPQTTVDALTAAESIISINASPAALERLTPVLARLDTCRVLISHLGDPGAHATTPSTADARDALKPLLALAKLPHVGVKLSGLYGISDPPHDYPHHAARPFVELLVDRFGPQRLYWGSDFSPALDFVSFSQTVEAVANLPWTDSEREAVMAGNLRELLARSREGDRPL
jgi:L-fuconolactonase